MTVFGTILENALMETVEVGSGQHKTRRPRYSLAQLLDESFKLPRKQDEVVSVSTLAGVDGAHFDEV